MNLSKWLMLVLMFAIGNMHAALKVTVVKKDENARKTYQENFLKHNKDLFYSGNFAGDITKVNEKDIPDFDFLFALEKISLGWIKLLSNKPILKVSFLISALRLSRCRQIKCSFFLSLISKDILNKMF
jgi:hypothetical protein